MIKIFFAKIGKMGRGHIPGIRHYLPVVTGQTLLP